jgi:hypothetical protein
MARTWNTAVGIIAFGSLVDDRGWELEGQVVTLPAETPIAEAAA